MAETWIIIGADRKPVTDIYGNPAVFTAREEAERWLMPGERVELVDTERGSPQNCNPSA